MKRLFFFAAILFFAECHAQTANEFLTAGNALFREGKLYLALEQYQRALFDESDNAAIRSRIADTFFHLRDYQTSLVWYEELLTSQHIDSLPLARYWYAMNLKMLGKYEQARVQFEEFLETANKRNIDAYYIAKTEKEILSCANAPTIFDHPLAITVSNIGSNVNSPYSDFAPFLDSKGVLYFSSVREHFISNELITMNADIFCAKKIENEWFMLEKEFPFLNSVLHEGSASLSFDEKKLYFTRCTKINEMNGECFLFVAEKNEHNEWINPVALSRTINLPDYVTTNPYLVSSESGDAILYFASNRPGGAGGWDIWYSEISSDGTMREPRNVGNTVNTSENEMSPFYFSETHTLYFSSEGHDGIGGMDIFSSVGEKQSWKTTEHLGVPINSSVDDMYFTIFSDGASGFLVSNREGGTMATSETCCEDIYEWKGLLPQEIIISLTVNVFNTETREPISDAIVFLIDAVEQISLDTNIIEKKRTYDFTLASEKEYKILVQKSKYFSSYQTVSTKGKKKKESMQLDIFLEEIQLTLDSNLVVIYYGFNEAVLTERATRVLDSIATMLKKIVRDFPRSIIEIGAHTDDRGTEVYNAYLSYKRAKSVVDYFVNNGIPYSTLRAKGYGEEKPIDNNDTENGRQKNRRTEIKMLRLE